MSFRTTAIAITVLLSTNVANADDTSCGSWFCGADDAPAESATPYDDASDPGSPAALASGLPVDTPVVLTMKDGQILHGVVMAIGPESLTVKTPAGLIMTIDWPKIAGFKIEVAAANTPPTKIPAPAAVAVPTTPEAEPEAEPVAAFAPATSTAQQTKSQWVDSTYDDEERLEPRKKPGRFGLALRLGLAEATDESTMLRGGAPMRELVGPGAALEIALAYRIAGGWWIRGFYEEAWFAPGRMNRELEREAISQTVGAGFRFATQLEEGFGIAFEIGLGYRWLTVPHSTATVVNGMQVGRSGETTYGGLQSLRMALGPTLSLVDGVRTDLLVNLSVGRFGEVRGHACESSEQCGTISDADRSTHAFLGASLGLSLEP